MNVHEMKIPNIYLFISNIYLCVEVILWQIARKYHAFLSLSKNSCTISFFWIEQIRNMVWINNCRFKNKTLNTLMMFNCSDGNLHLKVSISICQAVTSLTAYIFKHMKQHVLLMKREIYIYYAHKSSTNQPIRNTLPSSKLEIFPKSGKMSKNELIFSKGVQRNIHTYKTNKRFFCSPISLCAYAVWKHMNMQYFNMSSNVS